MLPDDTRKRLQVVNNVNPSIRQAATPASFLQNANVNPQGSTYNPQQQTFNPQATVNFNTQSFAPSKSLSVGVSPYQALMVGGKTITPGPNLTAPSNVRQPQTGFAGFSQPFIDAGKSFVGGAGNIAAIPIYEGFSIGSRLNGDRLDTRLFQDKAATGVKTGVGLIQGIPRIATQVAESANPLGGDVRAREIVPTKGWQKFLVGNQPIPSMQKEYNADVSSKGSAYAKGHAAVNAIMAAQLLKGGIEKAKSLSPTNELSAAEGRLLSKTQDPAVVQEFLARKLGVTPESVADVSQQIADTSGRKNIHGIVNNHVTMLRETAAAEAALTGAISEASNPQDVRQIVEQHYPNLSEVLGENNVKSLTDVLSRTDDPETVKSIINYVDNRVVEANSQPAYQRGAPSTVGEAVSQHNLGVDNLDQSVLSANERIKSTGSIEPSTAYEDIPSFIKKDPQAAISAAEANISRIDKLIHDIGNSRNQDFANKQWLAEKLQANPENRQAIMNEYTRRQSTFDAASVEEQVKKLVVERNRNEQIAKTASNIPEAPSSVNPTEQTLRQEAIAQAGAGVPENTTAPVVPGKASATSVESTPTGLVEQTNKTADTLNTGLGIKESPLKRAALSVNGELERYGEGGKAIAQANKGVVEISERGQAEFMQKIPAVLKLKKSEFTQFVDALEALSKGERVTNVSSDVGQALTEWTTSIQDIRNIAQGVGIDVGDLGQYYFPHNYSDLLKNQDGLNRAVNHLVETGQAANTVEARQMLEFAGNPLSSKFGSLEKSRQFDLPGYSKSKDALLSYLNGAYERIGQADQFGAKGEKAAALIDQGVREGYDGQRLTELYKVANGLEDTQNGAAAAVSSKIQSLNRLKSLGLSAITNATQTVNDITKGGVWRSLKAYTKQLSPEEWNFARETGVATEGALSKLREGSGVGNKLTGKLTAPGFNTVETFNRVHSAITGKLLGDDLAVKVVKGSARAEESLRKLGVTGDIGETLTREQQIQAARGFVEATQFKVSPQDLPRWVQTPAGKLVAQFRTFSYKQTGFIYNEVLKEAAQGNLLPLVRFTTVGAAAGYLSAQAKGFLQNQVWSSIKGKQDDTQAVDKGAAQKWLDSIVQVGGLGLGDNIKFLAQNRASTKFPQYLAGALGGPTAGTAVETATNTQKAFAGDRKPIERQGVSSIPIIGKGLANTFTPYDNTFTKAKNNAGVATGNVDVKDASGVALLDDRGKKITVKIPRDATPLQREALYQKAQSDALTRDMANNFSGEDRSLMSLDDTTLQSYVDNGKIDQARYDQIQAEKQAVNNVTKNKIPKVTSDNEGKFAAQFYKRVNAMTPDARKAYLEGTPDVQAKQAVDMLNKQLLPGLKTKISPSNKITNLLANFNKDFSNNSDKTATQKRAGMRDLWKNVLKESAGDEVGRLISANENDIRYLINDKQISKEAMKAAINLDNEMLAAKLITSPNISNKLRRKLGFGEYSADGTGGSGGTGGGRGGSRTTQLGLSQLLPKTLTFSQPSINTSTKIPTLNIGRFKPSDVRGTPRGGRAVSLRTSRTVLK